MLAHKFVNWDVPALDELSESFIYQVNAKLVAGEHLSREEKDRIFDYIYSASGGKGFAKISGWAFDFRPFFKWYIVEFRDGSLAKYCAPDKTALRRQLFYIWRIYDLPKAA